MGGEVTIVEDPNAQERSDRDHRRKISRRTTNALAAVLGVRTNDELVLLRAENDAYRQEFEEIRQNLNNLKAVAIELERMNQLVRQNFAAVESHPQFQHLFPQQH